MMRRVLLVGCGYVGKKIAEQELASGALVEAIVKSTASADSLRSKGMQVLELDLDAMHATISLSENTYQVMYYLLPPQPEGVMDFRITKFLRKLSDKISIAKIVLISTTGVYGNCDGEWVDESRKPNPTVARAHRRLSAEQQCEAWAAQKGVGLTILRVGGIYGAGKLPLARLKRSDPVLAIDESPWSNRIYVKDLVEVCYRAARSRDSNVLNVVDGSPSTMTEYFLQIADFAGIERPVQIKMQDAKRQLGEGILSYLAESRRIGNDRLIKELGYDCVRFPTLNQGLEDIKLDAAPQ